MTKKDFELIAKAISEFRTPYTDIDLTKTVRIALANDFAVVLKKENPRFDEKRFMAACIGE